MKHITIIDEKGNTLNAIVAENETEKLKEDVAKQKKQNFKEHLYITYLVIGSIAFTLGILISIKRLNGGK